MSKQKLKTISGKLKKASKAHASQAKQIDSVISALPMQNMKSSALKKISAACKSAAKRKFKVWPSAYASGWGVRCTRAGGPGNFGGGKKKK
jgi:phospholipid N-methyltransferase